MRVYSDMFGPYRMTIYGGGVAIEVTAPDGTSVHLQGDESSMLCDEIADAVNDIASGVGRWARIGERLASEEIFGPLFY